MTTGDVAEIASVLAKRRDVLAALCDGAVEKRTLVEELGVPRTTLDRAVRELVDAALAERADGGVRATAVGAECLAERDRYRARLDGLKRGEPLLEALPDDTALGARFLTGASVSRPDPSLPDGVVTQVFESVRSADEVYGIAPAALSGHFDTFDAAATTDGVVPRMVVTPAVLDHLVERRPEQLAAQIREGAFEFHCCPVDVAFGLWVAARDDRSDEAGVVVYTDTGISGVAVNDDPGAVAWARERFDRARVGAERVTPDVVRAGRHAPESDAEDGR